MREGRFEEFQHGKTDVLVCTDIASRGLDTKLVKVYLLVTKLYCVLIMHYFEGTACDQLQLSGVFIRLHSQSWESWTNGQQQQRLCA